MKTLISKDALTRMALCVCFLSTLPIAQGAEPITITMTADHWQTKENAEFFLQLGFYHGLMRLNIGDAVLKGITFSDGTIEFDVNTIGRAAPGIAFRQQDEDNFELLYLRPDPACPAFRACIQYAPQTHGVLLWDLFPQYQTRAPLRENGWNHIKMVVLWPTDECFRERCGIAHTGGRQVRGGCDEKVACDCRGQALSQIW